MLLFEKTLGLDPARGVVVAHEGFLAGHDSEVPLAVVRDVLYAVGVELELFVAPAIATDVVCPHRGIRGRVLRTIEFVGRCQGPAWGRADDVAVGRPTTGAERGDDKDDDERVESFLRAVHRTTRDSVGNRAGVSSAACKTSVAAPTAMPHSFNPVVRISASEIDAGKDRP